ncbi:MAG: dethiobiotin synthase [Nitrospina sp.]|nr:dethiobiotin synthase [Nitrospina sp.]
MVEGYFITGTDTGVGKTAVTASLLLWYRHRGLDAGAMKPVETGVDPECHSAANSDACFLMEAGELRDAPDEVCLFRFKTPAAPWQAAMEEGRDAVDLDRIVSTFDRLSERHDRMLVEGIGGLMVPLTPDRTVADLAGLLKLPLILVTRYTLGTQNHTLLTVEQARNRGLALAGLVFNQTEPGPLSEVEQKQPSLLSQWTGLPVLAELPFLENPGTESWTPEALRAAGGVLNLDLLEP